jgi:hypothetical protein
MSERTSKMAGQEYNIDYDWEDRENTRLQVFNALDDMRRMNVAQFGGTLVMSAPEEEPEEIDQRPPIYDRQ